MGGLALRHRKLAASGLGAPMHSRQVCRRRWRARALAYLRVFSRRSSSSNSSVRCYSSELANGAARAVKVMVQLRSVLLGRERRHSLRKVGIGRYVLSGVLACGRAVLSAGLALAYHCSPKVPDINRAE